MHKSFWDLVKGMPSLPALSTEDFNRNSFFFNRRTSFSFAVHLEYNM